MAEPNGASASDAASPQASGVAAAAAAPSTRPINPSTPPPQASQSQPSQPQIRPSQAVTSTTENPASSTDTGNAIRPHDARTIHMVLASLGVTAYQERVPLQLLDFAYRYTGSVLSDAQHLAIEGYVSGSGSGAGGKNAAAAAAAGDQVTLAALRLATSSRLGYQFSSGLPKQTLLDLARERNAIQLPDPGGKVVFGLHLPHERFVQTGTNWSLLEEWDSEDVVDEEAQDGDKEGAATTNGHGAEEGEDGDQDEEMDDGFEAVFGEGDKDGDDAENEMEE